MQELPHNIHIEQQVIGGLLKDANCQAGRETLDTLEYDDFYSRSHSVVFHAIKRMSEKGKNISLPTVEENLLNAGELESAGGFIYLAEMMRNFVSNSSMGSYCQIIRKHKALRAILELTQNVNEMINASNKPEPSEVLSMIEDLSKEISTNASGKELRHISDASGDWLDELQRREESGGGILGLSTGFNQLDEKLCGIGEESLVVIAGRPSMGKTLFTQAITQNVGIHQNKGVMFFSMEMSSNELYERFISSVGNVSPSTLRGARFNAEALGRIETGVTAVDNSNIYFTDEPTQSLGQIRAKARKHKNKNPDLSLIVIDYLGFIEIDSGASRHDLAIAKITRGLKQLAKEIKVPIILIAQANRETDKATRPTMSNIKDSSAIEADADVIMFIHREEVANPDTELKGLTEIIIAKDRHNGGNGTIYLEKINGGFSELTAEQAGAMQMREDARVNPPKEPKKRGFKQEERSF